MFFQLHKSVPKLVCNECDETFLSEEILAQHCKKRHERRRDYACDLCPKKFAFKQGLDRHFIQHKEQAFQCNYCDLRKKHYHEYRSHVFFARFKEIIFQVSIRTKNS